LTPCSPILAKVLPAGDDWLHEVKFDGYRVLAHKAGSRVVIFSRNGHDFTERFASIAQVLHELPAKTAMLDGEVVTSDADGRACFQQALSIARTQDARLLELRAATSLARLWREQDLDGDAKALLAPIYEWFREGLDLPDLQSAKLLLDELRA
jgi:ATP-dependent DNA ligase